MAEAEGESLESWLSEYPRPLLHVPEPPPSRPSLHPFGPSPGPAAAPPVSLRWARRRERPASTPLPQLGVGLPPRTCSPGCGASSRSLARRRELGSGPGLAGSGKVTAKCCGLTGRRWRGCGRLSPRRRDALRIRAEAPGARVRRAHAHSFRTRTVVPEGTASRRQNV